MDNKELIIKYLETKHIYFQRNLSLADLSYLKIGGLAAFFVIPENEEQVVDFVRFLKKNHCSYLIFGNGSNCLFGEGYIERIFISLKKLNRIVIDEENNMVNAEAGMFLPLFVNIVSQKGKTGFEGLNGIPGTIGGALRMNAGAYGNEIADKLADIKYLDGSGVINNISKTEARFSFRNSIFQEEFKSAVILSARFHLFSADQNEINRKIKIFQNNRSVYQEKKYPNLGSLFKTKDIYGDLARLSPGYAFLLWFLRKVSRFNGGKDNRIINYFTIKYFRLIYASEKPYSDKTLNCLVNRGHLTFAIAMEFIIQMKKILRDTLALEIEIVE